MATVSEIRDPIRPLQVALPTRSLLQRVYLVGTWLMLGLIIVQFAAAGATPRLRDACRHPATLSAYRSLVFVHVLSILVLLLCHGAAFTVSYVLQQERRPERIGVLLDISLASFDSRRALGRIFWIDLLVVVGSGIGLMIAGGWGRLVGAGVPPARFIALRPGMRQLGGGP